MSPITVRASAPGRVNLIGEHTDYNGGLVLPLAIGQRTDVAASTIAGTTFTIASDQQPEPASFDLDDLEHAPTWVKYAAGTIWALVDAGFAVPTLQLQVTSTVPLGAGLSSSASLEIAVGAAALAACGVTIDDESTLQTLIDAGIRAENQVVGAPTGGMDQAVVALARPGHALLIDFGAGSRQLVGLHLAGHQIVVTDTGVHHALADGGYGTRRLECDSAAAELGVDQLSEATLEAATALVDPLLARRARHVLTENQRVLDAVDALADGDVTSLGTLLTASHWSLADDFEVSCAELDTAVRASLAAGAAGARMTGGGFGGSIISLVPSDRIEHLQSEIDAAFADNGWAAPTHFTVSASAGVRLEPR